MTYLELATAMADYIINFYNPLDVTDPLYGLTPDEFEALTSSIPGRNSHNSGPINGDQVSRRNPDRGVTKGSSRHQQSVTYFAGTRG